ncbi:MAG: hypothetical protein WD000_06060 [Thermodesulfobacteriota bacterium]
MIKNITICALFILIMLSNFVYAYTETEYAIYQEVINTPMSVSENEALRRVGKKYGMSVDETKATVNKVMEELYSGGSKAKNNKKQKVEDSINHINNVKVKSVSVSMDYAAVTYVYSGVAWNDKDVVKKVTSGMPEILKAIFNVQGIERAKIKAFYPADGGEDKKVAVVECYKSEFNVNKSVDMYELTVYPYN